MNITKLTTTIQQFGMRGLVAVGLVLASSLSFASDFENALVSNLARAPAPETDIGQSATLLPSGQWLMLGGEGDLGPKISIVDPATRQSHFLKSRLTHARAFHSATLLPDGLILIAGGVGPDGRIVMKGERFDAEADKLDVLPNLDLTPRARHGATLLTDGRVLILGGLSDQGSVLATAEIWDPRTGATERLGTTLHVPRYEHQSVLLPSGTVLIWGGRGTAGESLSGAEIFDPITQRFDLIEQSKVSLPTTPLAGTVPNLAYSNPANNAEDVPIDAVLALRFSKPLAVTSLNAQSVTLLGPVGQVPIQVVPAESGLLLFVTLRESLQPGAYYTLFVSGGLDITGATLPVVAITFKTQFVRANGNTSESSPSRPNKPGTNGRGEDSSPSGANSSDVANNRSPVADAARDDESWTPGGDAIKKRGHWRSGRKSAALQALPPLQAATGVTALAGQVLLLDGQVADGTILKIGEKSVSVDSTGRFLLTELTPGRHVLTIDGTKRNKPGKTYGLFEARVDVVAGKTTSLRYTIWLPRIDTQHAVALSSPTTQETVVTTPFIPGLELHIPSGTIIRDRAGQIVTKISITPIPIDRSPFPLPTRYVPVYFTIQPGAAHVQGIDPASAKGARLIYPNYRNEKPGARIKFWHYDPVDKGWYVYGMGTVSADAKQIVPDPEVAIYEFTGAMVSDPDLPPDKGPKDCNKGDPVDCSTGLFTHTKTDLSLNDIVPLNLTRIYRQNDTRSRAFGIGANHSFDIFMVGDIFPYSYQELILADGSRVHFDRVSPGGSYFDAVYRNTTTPGVFFGATLAYDRSEFGAWKLALADGTNYWFPDAAGNDIPSLAGVTGMSDRRGNRVKFFRDPDLGNLLKVLSPNGRWIAFTYDSLDRVKQATDNLGRTVTYAYDGAGRLINVTDPNGGIERYTYDASDRMLTVKKPSGDIMVTNVHDTDGRVIQQTLADGGVFLFNYTLNSDGDVTQTDVTDPRGNVERITFNARGYPSGHTFALGKPEQQAYTYERDPASNLLLSETDPLGRKTRYAYDTNGKTTSITRLADTPQAVTESFTYGPFSQITSYTDGLGHTTNWTYDAAGFPATVADPVGNVAHFTYDGLGQLTSVTDPLGHTTWFDYANGTLGAIINPLGQTAYMFSDSAGRLTRMVDPLRRTTQREYDPLDRLTRVTDPFGGITQMAYDANSNLLSVTDPKGGVTAFGYDAKDRRSSRTDPLNHTEQFAYDGYDNLTQFIDRKGQTTNYTYDPLNRRTQATYPDATATYTYDSVDRLTQIADTQGGTITRGYDTVDRLIQEVTPNGQINYSYDAANRRTSMTVAGQPAATYTYDNANHLTGITRGSETVALSYDSASRRSSLTLPNGVVATYGYNAANQLTSINYAKAGTPVGDLSYEYDLAGQRVKMGGNLARMGFPAPVASATYNSANQLTSWDGVAHTYDANGNLTGDTSRTLTWDSRNRLTNLTGPVAGTFSYDAMGRRKSKSVAGTGTSFLYDGLNIVQELNGANPQANLLTGQGIDEVFARTSAGGSENFVTDGLGSTVALANAAGAVQTSYTYEAYGKAAKSGAATTNSQTYTGREDDGTGLYYYRARYYNPTLSRFVSEDPIGLAGGINTYAYVNGNPVQNIDPSGNGPTLATVAGAACGGMYHAYNSYSNADAIKSIYDGAQMARDLLRNVDERIASCKDPKEMQELERIRNEIARNLMSRLQSSALQSQGLQNLAGDMIAAGVCGLIGAAIPGP